MKQINFSKGKNGTYIAAGMMQDFGEMPMNVDLL